ncbi:1,4-beta-xylanase [Solibacillus sp. R5-41]|uniref:polysaccharide deacetylase family protein n=1 Tax=Solibacillus sp. R5-41 TaxID=2048654 RepID=UPI000C12798C|nr:polysaccharide deacetylase family protein [Solibacillus sp. R5-41]ATP38837.1 1,4-beta-xylanase [Solibacillus sp. R5-41]
MKNTFRKKRGPWIDFLLVGAILILGGAIVFLTNLNEKSIFQKNQNTGSKEITSDISEEESTFPGVKIISDISNDDKMRFAIQYPLTNFDALNEAITTYIDNSKEYYISMMRLQKDVKEHTGELNIRLDTYQYDHYYSFVLTNKMILNNLEHHTKVKTFLIDSETGKIFDIRTLLNDDIKSLETFASHIQSEILKNPKLKGKISQDKLMLATKPEWSSFNRFALKDESLIIYFDEGEIGDPSAGSLTFEMPLSFINPLLASDFQIAMEADETIIPKVDLDPTKKHVALTFDDGPHPKVTKQILTLLEKYDAKATFFMLGSRVQYYPSLVGEIRDAGHEIGNHSWSHPVLTKLSAAEVTKEFESTEHAIFNAIGQNSTVFRPPYGAINDSVKTMIPITSVNWTIDTMDWKHRNANSLLPIIQKSMHNNSIILMHDIHQSTADGLESVLAYLTNEGYEFLTVSEILNYHK